MIHKMVEKISLLKVIVFCEAVLGVSILLVCVHLIMMSTMIQNYGLIVLVFVVQ